MTLRNKHIALALLVAVACPAQTGPPKVSSKAADNSAVLFGVTMRYVRQRATLLNRMGEPIEHVGWNTAGAFKKITESNWVPVEKDGAKATMRMFRPLLIPGAPWMFMRGEILIAARAGARVEKIGEEGYHPLSLPGKEPIKVRMWKTTSTNGKWVGVVDDRIYECGDDGAGTQIGWIAFRDLAIDSGETVKVFMTKGMAPGSVWEGDVGDTTYREGAAGKGTPIARLEYHALKLDDGTETVILMSRAVTGKLWIGARNGTVINRGQ